MPQARTALSPARCAAPDGSRAGGGLKPGYRQWTIRLGGGFPPQAPGGV